MTPIPVTGITSTVAIMPAKVSSGFPFLSHRTVADVPGECGSLCLEPDRVSSVPILHGFGTDHAWQFLFIIPGDRQ